MGKIDFFVQHRQKNPAVVSLQHYLHFMFEGVFHIRLFTTSKSVCVLLFRYLYEKVMFPKWERWHVSRNFTA